MDRNLFLAVTPPPRPPAVKCMQDVADVGSVVWDAEVLLAHYLDQAYGSRLNGMRVLELGAGTGLAGIVSTHRKLKFVVFNALCERTSRTLNECIPRGT